MTDTSRNPATMTNEELHAHFSALLVSRAEDVDTRLGEFDTKLTNAVDKIDGLEKSFNAKLDVRFKELLNSILLLVHILILLIVMLYLCKLVLCYLVDHGNLIENLFIMPKLIIILLCMMERKLV